MTRNLDLASLRALATIADSGGVTSAAQVLNLTQSGVSMQIKRLENALDLTLLDRSGRGVSLTATGEQLLAYSRRMLALNDEAVDRLTDGACEGEIVINVPCDIVYPHIPQVLRHFQAIYPHLRVQLQARDVRTSMEAFANGGCDLMLAVESRCEPGGMTLARLPLVWIGARGGQAWRQRPLRLALGRFCSFRPGIVDALDHGGILWEATVESDSDRTLDFTVSCDMAVHALLAGTEPPHSEQINHGGELPDLGTYLVDLYVRPDNSTVGVAVLADLLRRAWRGDAAAAAAL